jgi:molecular chaperone GrpE
MTEKKKHTHAEHKAEHMHAEQKNEEEKAVVDAPQAEGAGESEALTALRAEIEQLRTQSEEYLAGWKRTQADLVNYRKRVERDAVETRRTAAGQAAARWFPVLDDFERALKDRREAQNPEQWAEGVEMIYRKWITALEAEGITPIDPAEGTEFDPNVHEAVTRELHPDREDGEILEVVHRGYRMGDRVLRPAQVRVAYKPEAE